MPLPLAPIAATALRYGAVALVAYAATRRIERARINQATEDALDEVSDGIAACRPLDQQQINAQGRLRRVVRFGSGGPSLELEATVLGRLKFRKV
jgi:hypothetical protein